MPDYFEPMFGSDCGRYISGEGFEFPPGHGEDMVSCVGPSGTKSEVTGRDIPNMLHIDYGMVVYGEIYGDGIQKGYTYGCGSGIRKLALFDITKDAEYLDFDKFDGHSVASLWPSVPVLYRGPYDRAKILELTKGDSVLCPDQKVREGVVVKPVKEQKTYMGRKVLKYINDEYLLDKINTEHH